MFLSLLWQKTRKVINSQYFGIGANLCVVKMKEHIKTIDNMELSDSEKTKMHKNIMQNKRNYLAKVGDIMRKNVIEDINPYVEHTNQGLNLRIVPKQEKTIKEIKAIAEYCGLNLISESKTNPDHNSVWLRFTVE